MTTRKIIEAGSAIFQPSVYMDCLYIKERHGLWQGELGKFFFDMKDYNSVFFSHGGIWAEFGSRYKNENCIDEQAEFIDIFDRGLFFSRQKYSLQKEYFVEGENSKIIGADAWGEDGIYISNFEGKLEGYLDGDFLPDLVRNNNLIYARSWEDSILCLNDKLETIWVKEFEKDCFSQDIFQTPQLYKEKNLVIVNVGEKTDAERGEFELNAYNADNGDLVWQVILEETPCSSNLIGDKVYIIVLRQLIIVDANNGEILVNVKHGFRPFDAATSTYQGMVCPMVDSSNLICISPMDRKVQIRSSDANQILQTINIPLPYMPSLTAPTEFEGRYYLPLQHIDSFNNGMKGGLLVFEFDLESDDQVEIEVEAAIAPRPPTSVDLVQNESGDDVYQVSIEHDADELNPASKTLDDLIRFSTIALKETAFKYGSYTSSTETNNHHHGQLLLIVKAEVLKKTEGLSDEELLEKLKVIKERVERNLADTGVQAGDGSSAFVVDIRLVE